MPWMRMKGSTTNLSGVHPPVVCEYVDSMWPLTIGEVDTRVVSEGVALFFC